MFSLVCVMLTVDPNKGKRKSRDQRYCEGSSESIKSARTYTAHNTEQSGLLRCSCLSINMRAVAFVLVAAIIAGCHARAVPQADEPLVKWEETVDRFWQFISELNTHTDSVVENLKTDQLSRELDTLITNTMAELNVYRADIETKLGPHAKDTSDQLKQDLDLLTNKLQTDMLNAKERSTQYLQELKTMLKQNADDVKNRVNNYIRKLKKRLGTDTDLIRNTVATYLGELQSRGEQNAETVKTHLEPYAKQVQEGIGQKLGTITDLFQSQTQGVSQQLEEQANVLKQQLEQTADSLRISLEGRIEELTGLLNPYTEKIREQLQTVLEKIQEASAALPGPL
ncbi:apolipoprotein Eb [Ictalurus punctatus]|uniref:Apolipoprotein Eb n=2 Tax=Ictalurus punctatus TaxID=7998 RepID=A0A2D0QY79_ICTPU|nr:apolipoprotein Eb [Ictalurus punctatus]